MPESALSRLARSTKLSKTEIAFRLSGANSVRSDSCQNLTVLETLQTYRAAKNPVNARCAQNFHSFSTTGILMEQRTPSSAKFGDSQARNGTVFRFRKDATIRRKAFRPCEGGRQKIDKRTSFGGPCFEGTLQESRNRLFLNQSLVAEANFSG